MTLNWKRIFILYATFLSIFFATQVAIGRAFDPNSDLRTLQLLNVNSTNLEISFFTNYEVDKVTIRNQSDFPILFLSYAGYVAKVVPKGQFLVPCLGESVSGVLNILTNENSLTINESPLCGDLVLIKYSGEKQ